MEASEEPDKTAAAGHVARQLERTFHRFGAALAEEAQRRLAHRRERVHLLCQRDLPLVPVVARDVQEFVRRILDRLDHLRMRMPGRANSNTGHEVEETIAVDVPHFGALAVRDDEWI